MKKISKDLIFWYLFVTAIFSAVQMMMGYNDPEYGFSGEGYGLGVITTTVFPLIWVMIYLFCRSIEGKNLRIEELERQCGIDNKEEQEEKVD